MICSKTELGSEFDTIKQLLNENRSPANVLLVSARNYPTMQQIKFWFRKVPSIPKLTWIGNASSKFENQINKAIISCFYAVKPCAIHITKFMLLSAKWIFMPM